MNCRRIEKLIPLHVEGDLDGDDATLLMSHLGSCANCRSVVEQYEKSQRWLHSCGGPESDEATLSCFRRGVMNEINTAARRRWLFWDHFNAVHAAVASLLILLAIIAIARYVSRHEPPSNRPEVAHEKSGPQGQPQSNADAPAFAAKRPPVTEPAAKDRKLGYAKAGATNASKKMGGHTLVASVDSKSSIGRSPMEASSPVNPVRIEIQTSDPSIRIIWFATREPESSSSLTEE